MNSALQYTTTSDGYRIAYSVRGSGKPFVLMPCIVQSDIARAGSVPVFRSFRDPLIERFKLVQYDGRGTGSSTRGLGPGHSMADTLLDLEAVVDKLSLPPFILYADVFTCYTALLFAARYPERVSALILLNPSPMEGGPLMAPWRDLYLTAWDIFVSTFAGTLMPPGDDVKDYFQHAVDHGDFTRLAEGAIGHDITAVLSPVVAPTLVLASRSPINPRAAAIAKEIAAGVANCRLAYFDGMKNADIIYSFDGGTAKVFPVIEEFLGDLTGAAAPLATIEEAAPAEPACLSPREQEVLKLIAAGRRNHQIAETLVISSSTVAKHVTSILSKTCTANRVEATTYAHEHRLV